jgi:hypothetical protein
VDVQPDTWCLIRVPADDTRLDGAVVELCLEPDGIFTAAIRIPGHQPERM